MAAQYKVQAVAGPHQWTHKATNTPMYDWVLQLVDAQGVPLPKNARLTTKKPDNGPRVDEVLTLDVGPHPQFEDCLKARKPQDPQQGGGGGRRPSDPKERASIEMQSSLRSAVDLTVGLARAGKLPTDFAETEKLTVAVVGIARAFFASIQEVSRDA